MEEAWGDFHAQRALEIRKGSITTTKSLIDAMQQVVPTDKQFIEAFEIASVSKSNLARYYLRVLENQAHNQLEPEFIPNANQDQVNLEHILPQNPSNAWHHLDAETSRTYYSRIGNLALLQKRPNSTIGNTGFSQKLAHYNKSSFDLTKSLTKYEDWGVEQIEKRQRELAQLAIKAWPNKI